MSQRSSSALFESSPISLWIEDFTEVKRLLDALETTSAEELREHFRVDPGLVHACVDAVRIVDVNPASVEMHGASSKQDLMDSLSATFTPDSLVAFRDELIDLASGASTTSLESRVCKLSGEVLDVMVRISLDPAFPNWDRVYVALVNMTDHKSTERALRRSEALLGETAEVSGVGGWVLELDHDTLGLTRESARILGERGILPATGTDALGLFQSKHGEALAEAVRKSLESREPFELEIPLASGEGETRWLQTRGRPVYRGSRAVRVHGTLEDVTERRAASAQRKRARLQVQHAQRLEGLAVLCGGVAHEFNNLLMAILGNVSLVQLDASLNLETRDRMGSIETAGLRAASLAKQMLAFSGQGKFTLERIDLARLLEGLEVTLEARIAKGARLTLELEPDLYSVEGDPAQLRQVMLDLVVNASEALGGKPGVIRLTNGLEQCDRAALESTSDAFRGDSVEALREGCYVYMEISDEGCGMDVETQERIFDPFFSTKFTGRGLGLAAVLGIIRGHGGALRITSTESRGTTMRVLLPGLDSQGEMISDS